MLVTERFQSLNVPYPKLCNADFTLSTVHNRFPLLFPGQSLYGMDSTTRRSGLPVVLTPRGDAEFLKGEGGRRREEEEIPFHSFLPNKACSSNVQRRVLPGSTRH